MRIFKKAALVVVPIVALSMSSLFVPASADSNGDSGGQSSVIYNSVITHLPGNLDSLGFEAVGFKEMGNAVNFSAGASHDLTKVVVTLSSWACVSGSWYGKDCVTPEDSQFMHPITLNIYGPSTDGGVTPGAKLASITNNFKIKYRPSASTECVALDRAGAWYNKSEKRCYNGLAQNITFNTKNVKVGKSAVFGISYNTSDYGYAPIGNAACRATTAGCPYDSLNFALTEDPTNVTAGSSVDPGKFWFNSSNADWYADAGVAGLGKFRVDSPNVAAWWGAGADASVAPWYVPAIKVFANGDSKEEKQSIEKDSSASSLDGKSNDKKGIKKD